MTFDFLGEQLYLNGAALYEADLIQVLAQITTAEHHNLFPLPINLARVLSSRQQLMFAQIVPYLLVFRVGIVQVIQKLDPVHKEVCRLYLD